MTLTVAFGCDHAGFALKDLVIAELQALGAEALDLGTYSTASVDYPSFGYAVAKAIADGRATRGVAICGSGIGIDIAANRNPAARAALCTSAQMAQLARSHNDANVLVLGARLIGPDVARACVQAFMTTPFEGGRHQRRVDMLGNPDC
ncbi:MAG: ribose 5-phosphate isomerase B [Sphingomonadales bacterium]|nr:MAG: ribose 5-phosphate isomerase B [Sphingomonadales bacterium]